MKSIFLVFAAMLFSASPGMTFGQEAAGAIPEDCSNEIDDDGDEVLDCEDVDCVDSPNCFDGIPMEVCNNGTDDDLNGDIDCDDVKCSLADACFDDPFPLPDFVGDCDNVTDCVNPNCSDAEVCQDLIPEIPDLEFPELEFAGGCAMAGAGTLPSNWLIFLPAALVLLLRNRRR